VCVQGLRVRVLAKDPAGCSTGVIGKVLPLGLGEKG
jgi:hypothetical protein